MNASEREFLIFEPNFDTSSSSEDDESINKSTLRGRAQRFTPQFDAIVDRRQTEFSFDQCTVSLQWTIAGRLWDSSVCLLRHLLRFRTDWTSVRVLELGAGVGLVSCVLARRGAHVVATDLGDALPLLRRNAAQNGSLVTVEELAWSVERAPEADVFNVDWDYIIAADCLLPYDPPLLFALAATLKFVTDRAPAATVLLVFEERFNVQPFFDVVDRDFVVEHVPIDDWQEPEGDVDSTREPAIKLTRMHRRALTIVQ
jgi:predicted nicotinamide N-methyase